MLTAATSTGDAGEHAAVQASAPAQDREPRLQARDLAPNYGAWRGVRAHAADVMSRLERRAIYLPGL